GGDQEVTSVCVRLCMHLCIFDSLRLYGLRSAALSSEETVTFVQTDKPIYKSGENGKSIFMIFQWQNVTSSQNITELSFQLVLEPVFGDYSIVVKEKSGKTLTHQFTVDRNVLPKFEVKVSAPQTITISDDEFQISTCAKYTFGQPVHGKVQVQVCRGFFSSVACEKDKNEICEQFVAQTNLTFFVVVDFIADSVQISEKSSIFITPVLGSVSFKNMDTFYRRGISYFGTLKFSSPNNVPMVNKLLQLELNDRLVGNYTTDENGEAQFSIDTSDIFDPEFHPTEEIMLGILKIRNLLKDTLLIPEYMDGHFSVQRFYSRTSSFLMIEPEPKELRCNQEKIVTIHYSLNSEAYRDDSNINFFYLGNISFPINVSADLAPVAVMLVYTLHPSGEIIADSVKFQVDKCFKNKVSIKFLKEQGLPGSSTGLHLQASPNSVCALRAVDKRVLLLKSEQQLSAESVYNMLPDTELYGYFYRGLNLDDSKLDPCIPQKDMFYNGLYYIPVSNHGDGDTYDIVKALKLLHTGTSLVVQTNFPETWIWDLVSVDSSGSANLSFTIPDTITQWEATGFCVNGEAGFGISSTTSLEASQPFFVEITSPSSVVQNERSDLIVSVFSYLNTCVETYVWTVTPKKLVNITVVAESKQNSACPNEAPERQNLNWKDTVIKSLNILFVVFLGDIIGLAIQNLENLFQMPYGGGEQNIALLASDTYILDYLRSTKQLTEEVKSKALFFLSNGYQKQLSFKNLDGSYSVFWQRNQEGSIRLSALTFKTFAGMKKYVFIDELVQRETLIWLASKQKIDGCFKSDGKLFSNFPTLRNGLFCLEEALENGVRNGYNLAILAYAFALAGKEEKVESLLRTLDQSATKLNNVIYWGKVKKLETKASPLFIPRAPSAEMEKTCYVLLAIISQKNPDLTYASKIVQWLAQQMNSHGGFSSPQVIGDTPICLLAITRYMNLIFSDDQVTVSLSSEEFNEIFQVNGDNHLLVQRSDLSKASGQYTVDVEGQVSVLFLNFRYTGNHNNSNMVLVDVKMLSGFTPVMSSIEEVSKRSPVFQPPKSSNISGTAKSFTLSVEQINHVANIQPSPVMVYNYYEKGRWATTML
uniref:Alpha-2-macroglobulin domain-containing protein n=1 Tax=Capra hircus TaxID=9925 RepID=A0A452EFR9_CAPHI